MDARLAGDPRQPLVRRDEVVGAGDRVREARERVARAVGSPAMLSSIAASGRCSAAKPTNIVPWSVTVPYGMLRRKMWPKRSWSVLATCESSGLSRARCCRASSARSPAPARCDRKRLPRRGVVLPLLQQQDRAALAGLPVGHERDLRRLDQRRVLGAVDEAGEVAVVLVGPARRLVRDRGDGRERRDRRPRRVEDHVVGAAGSHSTASCCVAGIAKPSAPTRRALKPSSPGGVSRGAASRQSSGRNPATRLTPPIVVRGSRSAGDGVDELPPVAAGRRVELEVRVRGAEREDPGLWILHRRAIIAPIARAYAGGGNLRKMLPLSDGLRRGVPVRQHGAHRRQLRGLALLRAADLTTPSSTPPSTPARSTARAMRRSPGATAGSPRCSCTGVGVTSSGTCSSSAVFGKNVEDAFGHLQYLSSTSPAASWRRSPRRLYAAFGKAPTPACRTWAPAARSRRCSAPTSSFSRTARCSA